MNAHHISFFIYNLSLLFQRLHYQDSVGQPPAWNLKYNNIKLVDNISTRENLS